MITCPCNFLYGHFIFKEGILERTFNDMWNKNHLNNMGDEIKYDNWLEKYMKFFNKESKILELGCGLGNNAKFLAEHGIYEVATDLSEIAVNYVKTQIPQTEVQILDLTKPFQFEDNSFDIVIADLCLHYFSSDMTIKIMNEIKRVLKNGGRLFARVNSTKDLNHGAGQGKKLEENYYFVEGYNKRFFDERDTKKFFGTIGDCLAKEGTMERYAKKKFLIEIEAICKK